MDEGENLGRNGRGILFKELGVDLQRDELASAVDLHLNRTATAREIEFAGSQLGLERLDRALHFLGLFEEFSDAGHGGDGLKCFVFLSVKKGECHASRARFQPETARVVCVSALAAALPARRHDLFMSTSASVPESENCPCGSGLAHAACCGPILAGAPAPSAAALMRSRYTAYAKRDYRHLENSLSAEQRSDFSLKDARDWAESSKWLGLEVTATEAGGLDDQEGTVDFVARFSVNGEERKHVEKARFIREEGRWVYGGVVVPVAQPVRRETPKVGRNDPCPCGSGKKFKKCHGAG